MSVKEAYNMVAKWNSDNSVYLCKEYKEYFMFLFLPKDWDGKEEYDGGYIYVDKSDGSTTNFAAWITKGIDLGEPREVDIKELL